MRIEQLYSELSKYYILFNDFLILQFIVKHKHFIPILKKIAIIHRKLTKRKPILEGQEGHIVIVGRSKFRNTARKIVKIIENELKELLNKDKKLIDVEVKIEE